MKLQDGAKGKRTHLAEDSERPPEILPFGVDIADPIFRNSVISVKHMGRYGYGGPPGPSPDSEVWAQILTRGARSRGPGSDFRKSGISGILGNPSIRSGNSRLDFQEFHDFRKTKG